MNSTMRHILKIINSIAERPCAAFFRYPVDPCSEELTNYYSIVKNPMDIQTICTRLTNNYYREVSEVTKDVKQILNNCQLFYGNSHPITALAAHMLYVYKKEMKTQMVHLFEIWQTKYYKLTNKLDRIVNAAARECGYGVIVRRAIDTRRNIIIKNDESMKPKPKKSKTQKRPVKYIAVYDKENESFDSGSEVEYKKHPPKLARKVTDKQVNDFLTAVSILPNLQDARQLTIIIVENQPELEVSYPDVKIDIEALTDNTMLKCIEYVRNRFSEMNKVYPG